MSLFKTPSGIPGLDEITCGGLPVGRPTLVCGGAGSGKTLFAMTFLLEGALQHGEAGVFMCFEEREEELASNVASLGYDLPDLVASKRIALDYVHIERSEIEETGEYDLEGLFVRLDYAIKSVGAKRVVLDTLEALFAGVPDTALLRAELRRLFRWLKERGVTALITAERGEGTLTRHGLEEYVSDCVISLDHRVIEQVATRRLRVVKYRGTAHGTNEYPFLIDGDGIVVMPVTSVQLAHEASLDRITTGIEGLDGMLDGRGFYRGSSILVTGMSGTGKSTVAAHFADAACRRGERALYFAFEESPPQIIRNMRSVGIELAPWQRAGLLRFSASRPTLGGLEMHLARMYKDIEAFAPDVVVIDPIYNLSAVGSVSEVRSMLLRLVDYLKSRRITALAVAIDGGTAEAQHAGVSSLMDAWIQLEMIERDGERNRGIYILKARGLAHSNKIREFLLTSDGIRLRDVHLPKGGALVATARTTQAALESPAENERQQVITMKQQEMERRRLQIEAQISALRAELDSQVAELTRLLAHQQGAGDASSPTQGRMSASRGGKS